MRILISEQFKHLIKKNSIFVEKTVRITEKIYIAECGYYEFLLFCKRYNLDIDLNFDTINYSGFNIGSVDGLNHIQHSNVYNLWCKSKLKKKYMHYNKKYKKK